jgi:hypothetical protein
MKKRTICWGVAALAIIALVWMALAVAQLRNARSEFDRTRSPESNDFFSSASLVVWPSLRPLIKNPFRSDIRLYFDHIPKINRHSHDAWASNETGTWQLKIHN